MVSVRCRGLYEKAAARCTRLPALRHRHNAARRTDVGALNISVAVSPGRRWRRRSLRLRFQPCAKFNSLARSRAPLQGLCRSMPLRAVRRLRKGVYFLYLPFDYSLTPTKYPLRKLPFGCSSICACLAASSSDLWRPPSRQRTTA